MTPTVKHVGLAVAGVILVFGTLALALAWPRPLTSSARERSEKPMPKQTSASIPAIDAAQPAVTETATFALG